MTVDTELILKNIAGHMMRNRIPMRTVVYVPAWYEIVYPETDRTDMEDLEPLLLRQARTTLNETLERLNRPTMLERFLPWFFRRRPVEKTQEWRVDIIPSGAVPPGRMEIYHRVKAGKKMALSDDVTQVVMPGARQTETTVTVTSPVPRAKVPAFAVLTWQNGNGPQSWRMTKEEVIVGRGGLTDWADCLLEAGSRVSRRHFRIRRNPSGDGLEIFDQSTHGTALDGEPCPHEQWHPLPVPCELTLAGELSIRVGEPAE